MRPYVSPASRLPEKSHSSPIKRGLRGMPGPGKGTTFVDIVFKKKSACSQIKPCVKNVKLLPLVNFTLAQDLTHPGNYVQDSLGWISKILKHSRIAVCERNHY